MRGYEKKERKKIQTCKHIASLSKDNNLNIHLRRSLFPEEKENGKKRLKKKVFKNGRNPRQPILDV